VIIQIFDNNGSATGAVNYVLSIRDWKGNLREVAPKILQGSANYTKMIDEQFCRSYKNKCISGVIAFADNENLTEQQKMRLIKDFENTFLGNMKDKTNAFYVEHRDKGNLEIHFIINRVAIFGQSENDEEIRAMAYNPFPPGKMTIELKDCFRDLQIEKFGFEHIKPKPNTYLRSQKSKAEKQARRLEKEETSFLHLENKEQMEKAIKDLVKLGEVSNRDELMKFLVAQGLQVKNTGKSISVENKHVKAERDYEKKYGTYFRFSGGIFERNNDISYKELKQQKQEEAAKPKDFEAIAKKLERLVKARNDYNTKRFKAKEKQPPKFAEKIAHTVQERSQQQRGAEAQERSQQAGAAADQEQTQPQAKTAQNGSKQLPDTQAQDAGHPSYETHGASSSDNESANAQDAVNNARSALANARTPEQTERARIRLGVAQARLNAILARIDAEKKKTKIKI
jgi:hypothetical protein